jgi:signal peptidase I
VTPAPKTPRKGGFGSIFVVLLIVFIFRSFGAEAFVIPTGSAIPTLLIGDHVAVSKFAYGYDRYSLSFVPRAVTEGLHGRVLATEPKRGDVVVFVNTHSGETLIKRFVGLPGDRLQVMHGVLFINGQAAKRSRVANFVDSEPGLPTITRYHYVETLPNGVKHDILGGPIDRPDGLLPQDNTSVYVVPPGHYFGMGDNRDNSEDSRFLQDVGYIPADTLVGRAEFQILSLDDGAAAWQFWKWPRDIRISRFFQAVH